MHKCTSQQYLFTQCTHLHVSTSLTSGSFTFVPH